MKRNVDDADEDGLAAAYRAASASATRLEETWNEASSDTWSRLD